MWIEPLTELDELELHWADYAFRHFDEYIIEAEGDREAAKQEMRDGFFRENKTCYEPHTWEAWL
jgi:hypothetical protein